MRYTYEVPLTGEIITPYDAKEKFIENLGGEFDEDENIVLDGKVVAERRLVVPEVWTVRVNGTPYGYHTAKDDALAQVRVLAEKAQGLHDGAYYGNLHKNHYLVAVQHKDNEYASAVVYARKENIEEVYEKDPLDFWKEVSG